MIICKGVVVVTRINCNRCFRWHQEAYDECTIVQNEGFSFLFLDFGSLTVSNKRKSIIACQREKMWYQKSKNRNHIEDYDNEGQKETWCEEDRHQVLLGGQGFDPGLLQAPANNNNISNFKLFLKSQKYLPAHATWADHNLEIYSSLIFHYQLAGSVSCGPPARVWRRWPPQEPPQCWRAAPWAPPQQAVSYLVTN